MGLIMWTLIGRVAMNIFLPLHSDFFFMRVFVKYTDPVIKVFDPVTPRFLVEPLVPLLCCVVFLSLQVLFHALGTRVFGDGYAFLSLGG